MTLTSLARFGYNFWNNNSNSSNSQKIVSTSGDPLNVRSSPGSNNKAIGKIDNGSILNTTGNSDGKWTEIEYENQKGWVHSDYIKTK